MKKELDKKIVERVLAEAIYYSQGKSTIDEAAERFSVSRGTFLTDLNKRLAQAVTIKLEELETEANRLMTIINAGSENDTSIKKLRHIEADIARYNSLVQDVVAAKEKQLKLGNSKGGKTARRPASISYDEIEHLVDEFIASFGVFDEVGNFSYYDYEKIAEIAPYTIRSFSEKTGISKSTLYEYLTSCLDPNKARVISAIFSYNKTTGKKGKR